MNDTGATIIVMAYPYSHISLEGMWYKKPLKWMGLSNRNYIYAGHAALSFIDHRDGQFYYLDFGRYITPYGYGRMRSKITDPDVDFDFRCHVKNKKVENLDEILLQLADQEHATHGELPLYASTVYTPDASRVVTLMHKWIEEGCVPYGPVKKSNSNCSRFVLSFLLEGLEKDHPQMASLRKSYWLTPSTMSNVLKASEDDILYKIDDNGLEKSSAKDYRDPVLKWFFTRPDDPPLHKNNWHPPLWQDKPQWQWLGGTGSGAWFRITDYTEDLRKLKIACHNVYGEILFESWFEIDSFDTPQTLDLTFDYESNAAKITLRHDGKTYRYEAVANVNKKTQVLTDQSK